MSNEDAREAIVGELVARNRLWPLIDSLSCRFCAQPRKPEFHKGFPTCWSCKNLRETYENALLALVPITYSTRTWALGEGLRYFKDNKGADPAHKLALRFGAVLSLYLEHQLPRLAPIDGFTMVIAVPSSKPVIANSLQRAASEGWCPGALDRSGRSEEGDAPPARRVHKVGVRDHAAQAYSWISPPRRSRR